MLSECESALDSVGEAKCFSSNLIIEIIAYTLIPLLDIKLYTCISVNQLSAKWKIIDSEH